MDKGSNNVDKSIIAHKIQKWRWEATGQISDEQKDWWIGDHQINETSKH